MLIAGIAIGIGLAAIISLIHHFNVDRKENNIIDHAWDDEDIGWL